nr:iron chelate uptake ABC transporter family permease subunit [Candidatus Baldrarchaeota archaeon]
MPNILDVLLSPFMIRAIIAVVLIAFVASTAGSFTVYRGLTFLVAGVAHAALAGAALAILLDMYGIIPGFPEVLGAAIFAIITALIAGYVGRKGESEKMEVAIGVSFALTMSIAILLISMIKEYAVRAWGLIIGDILLLTEKDLLLLAVATLIVIFTTLLFYKEFVFVSFDMEGATAYGVHAELYHYVMLLLIALSVVVVLKGVGAILVYAMIVAPAAAANQFSKSTTSVMIWSFIIALFGGIIGLIIAALCVNVAPSAIAGLIVTASYFIALIVSRK